MKKVSRMGCILMTGVMMVGCGQSSSSNKQFPTLLQGKVTGVDRKEDKIFLDTGSVRKGADVSITGIMAADRQPLPHKGDYVLFSYDSLHKRVDTIITIRK